MLKYRQRLSFKHDAKWSCVSFRVRGRFGGGDVQWMTAGKGAFDFEIHGHLGVSFRAAFFNSSHSDRCDFLRTGLSHITYTCFRDGCGLNCSTRTTQSIDLRRSVMTSKNRSRLFFDLFNEASQCDWRFRKDLESVNLKFVVK